METDIYSYMTDLDERIKRQDRNLQCVIDHLHKVGLLPDGQHGEKSGTSGSGQIGIVKSPV